MRHVMLTALVILVGALNCASGEPGAIEDGRAGNGGKASALFSADSDRGTVWTRSGGGPQSVTEKENAGVKESAGANQNAGTKEGAGANQSAGTKESAGANQSAGTKESAGANQGAGTKESAGADSGDGEPRDKKDADREEEIWKRTAGCRPGPVDHPDDLTEGQMRVETRDGLMVLPLAHTSVEAEVSGMLTRVWVTQYFTNPYDHPIEAVYVFPLPQMAAVDDMQMHIGDRVIKGIMKKRDEARQIYEDARRQGKTASLLEQERPNIFTQSVANILPGDRIKVRIRYVEDLKYEDAGYEFVFPMVVGPRFIPGNPTGKQAGGWSPDTDKVPDASRITPPVLKPGQRSGHDIDVTLTIRSGVEVTELQSPSHDMDVTELSGNALRATLKPHDTLPNKDLVVRFKTAGDAIKVASLFHASKAGRYFMLVFQPQKAPRDEEVVPRELVFVLDCSGSMSGTPISKSKEAVKKLLKAMRPDDEFQIINFSEAANGFAPHPVPNTAENLKRALQFVDQLQGEGGTMMIEGIKASLDYPHDSKRMRIVAFLTDGYVGNDDEILAAVKSKVGDSRLFSFGIGSSVNRYLLEGMGKLGRGAVTYVRQDESPDAAVERFYKRLDSPVLADIEVTADGDVDLTEVNPTPVPDLFAGQPLVVHGRYEGSGRTTVVVTGRQGNREFREELSLNFPGDEPENGVLATLWARTKIEYLMNKMLRGEDADLVAQVTKLAIEFNIMSQYTSFVAVEEQIRNKGGHMETVQVPVETPEGVSYEGVFGKDAAAVGGSASQIPAAAAPSPTRGQFFRAKKSEAEKAPAAGWSGAIAAPAEAAADESRDADDGNAGKGASATATLVPTTCTVTVDSVTVLEGPVTEKEVTAAVKAALAKLGNEAQSACQSAGDGPDSTLVDVSLTISGSGAVTVKSVQFRDGSSQFRSAAAKGFEKRLSSLQFAGESSATLVKVTLAVSCQ